MIILGSSNDDRGTQLERLTVAILQRLGYCNITTNLIGTGGEEIDVSGEYHIPAPSTVHVRKLICECKAYKNTVDTTQWLKFLGKVYVEKTLRGQEVFGCFIALSGVNGNVTGSFEEIKSHGDNISLVTGDRLTELLRGLYSICSFEQVSKTVQLLTSRQFRLLELCYYDRCVYWLVIFNNDEYSILDAEAHQITTELALVLCPMLESNNPVRIYINLTEEALAKERAEFLQKLVLIELMKNNSTQSRRELESMLNEYSPEEIATCINTLARKNWIIENNNELSLLNQDNDHFYEVLVDIMRFLLVGKFVIDMLGCDYYDRNINDNLLQEILKIQGNLTVTPEVATDLVQILQWSPTALFSALTPDPMLVGHRTANSNPDRDVDLHDCNYLTQKLYRGLEHDFGYPPLNEYFGRIRGIREIEIIQRVIVKNDQRVILQGEVKERRLVAPASEELGGGYITALALNHAPQPWDMFGSRGESQERNESLG